MANIDNTKNIHFGQSCASDMTQHNDSSRKQKHINVGIKTLNNVIITFLHSSHLNSRPEELWTFSIWLFKLFLLIHICGQNI